MQQIQKNTIVEGELSLYAVNSSKINELIQQISDIINELIKHTPYLKEIELKRWLNSQCEQRFLGRVVSWPLSQVMRARKDYESVCSLMI